MNAIQTFWWRPRRLAARRWVFYLHLYCGLIIGILMAVVSLTGSILVFRPEMERQMVSGISHVVPGGRPISFQKLYDLVRASEPKGAKIENAYLYASPDLAWSFRVGYLHERREVYVDQYRGKVLGVDHFHGKFTAWVYDLHVNLLSGKTGLMINGIGAFILTLMCITGFLIWWPGRKNWRFGLHYAWRARWKRQNYDVHKIIGAFSLLPLALVAMTGAYFAFPKLLEIPVELLTHAPAVRHPPKSRPTGNTQRPDLDNVLNNALVAMAGGEATLFTFPTSSTQAYSLRKFLPGDWRRTGDNLVYLDQSTGKVLRIDYHSNLPFGIRLVRDIAPLHYGTFFGYFSRIFWVFLGLTPLILYVSGTLMWWNRVLSRYWAMFLKSRREVSQFATAPVLRN